MGNLNSSSGQGLGSGSPDSKPKKSKFKRSKAASTSDDQEVLLNLPAGLKYKMPGKRQRVVLGSLVIGLNFLLVLAVVLYFYNPAFHDFIFNVGRN